MAGIGVTTLSEWREKHPQIEQRIDEARETAQQKALQRIKAAGDRDWRANAEWLRLTFLADYRGNVNKVEVSATAQASFVITQEQLRELRDRLEATREALLSGGRSDTGGTVKNEEEIDAEPSRQKLSDSVDSALRPPLPAPLNYPGQPIQAGEPYGGRGRTAKVEEQPLNAVSVIPVASYTRETISDKFGHSERVILGESAIRRFAANAVNALIPAVLRRNRALSLATSHATALSSSTACV